MVLKELDSGGSAELAEDFRWDDDSDLGGNL